MDHVVKDQYDDQVAVTSLNRNLNRTLEYTGSLGNKEQRYPLIKRMVKQDSKFTLCHTVLSIQEPRSVEEAKKKEYKSLVKTGAWKLVNLPNRSK